MDVSQFLARVVPAGNFVAVNWKTPNRDGMAGRFFPGNALGEAAGFLRWACSVGADAYVAPAAFIVATPDGADARGKIKFKGSRTHENIQALKAFWIDIDVKREGDKKGSNVYADRREALTWLLAFLAATGLPRPNLWVNSGYGYHVYWVLEDAMTRDAWQPYALALAAAMKQHGFKCETGISSDAARILRPPETNNLKGAAPAPVTVLDQQSRGDYPNQLIFTCLQPYVGLTPALTPSATAGSAASALAGGGASPLLAGRTGMNAAAVANIPTRRHHEFVKIAARCKQAEQSLASQGNGDPYPLWYLGFLTLLHYCADGSTYTHEISKGDPRYTAAAVDAAVGRVASEQAKKDRGPPRCASFDNYRPGVCQSCPYHGKILSPWNLGADDGDLPDGYRRHNGWIERRKLIEEGEETWVRTLSGDVHSPVLDHIATGGFALNFIYERAAREWDVRVNEPELPTDAGALCKYFGPQHVTMQSYEAPPFREFVVAWLNKLRDQRAERMETVRPFGYVTNNQGLNAGLAIGGTLYRADGIEEGAPGGDLGIVNAYRPNGDIARWRAACDLVCSGRPDLQTLVAASFGAPLMHFTGHAALIISAWSADSAVGKSSALRIGQAVWSSPNMMNSMDDTPNSVNAKLSQTRIMPCYWDEMRVGKDYIAQMVNNLFALTQGKEKSRLRSDTSMRTVGEWETLVVVASNTPFMENVVSMTDGTDAGALRLFEFKIEHPQMAHDSSAQRTIAMTKDHYGSAGRVYAKYIAENHLAVDTLVDGFAAALNTSLKADRSERFYIAGMACLLAGAKLANQLQLAKFDTRAIYEFLRATFYQLRADRKVNLLVSNGHLDAESVLSLFMSDMLAHRILTNRFATRGPRGDFKVVAEPHKGQRVEVQVAQRERTIRINRTAFIDWCRRKNYGHTEIRHAFVRAFNAAERRAVIAAGTEYGGGELWCIDIPLSGPATDDYLFLPGTVVAVPAASAANVAHATKLGAKPPI